MTIITVEPQLEPSLMAAVSDHIERLAADGTLWDQFVALKMFKAQLDQAAKRVKEAIDPRERLLLDEFIAEGARSKRHAASGKLTYISRRIWARARGGDKAAACIALRDAGLGDYVEEGFNTNSLSAYFRELAKSLEDDTDMPPALDALLPAALRGVIDLTEDFQLGLRA